MQPKNVQMFDLDRDPTESVSVADRSNRAELREQLLRLEKEWKDWTDSLKRNAKTFALPSALEARLESLGYLEPDPSTE